MPDENLLKSLSTRGIYAVEASISSSNPPKENMGVEYDSIELT